MSDIEKAPSGQLGASVSSEASSTCADSGRQHDTAELGNTVAAEKAEQTPDSAETGSFQREIHGIKWVLDVAAFLSCVFLFALDTTVVADIQPNIIASLGDFQKFPWLATAYALPASALVLIQSKVYALFDIKWLFFGYVTCFEVGSAISAAAPTMDAMIVGRMIAGIGGCGIYVGALTFFSVATTPKERPLYIALISPVWGVGTVLGPIIGGGFAESSLGWRWGFYINLVLFAFIAPVLLFLLPSMDFAKGQSAKQRLLQIDWLGLSVWTAWCCAFFMAVTYGGTLFAWESYSMIILWVFSGVLAGAFYLTHKFHPFVTLENRLYPSHLLRNLRLNVLQVATFSASTAVYIPIYYMPLYFQFAKGESPVEAAIKLMPFVIMIATVAILNGIFMSKVGYYMPWFLVGGAIATVGGGLMYTVSIDTSLSAIYGYSVLCGLGGGCFMLTAFGCVSDVVDPQDVFNAIGVLSLIQCLGITLFPSLSSTVFQNLGAKAIAPLLPADFTGDPRVILAGAHSAEWISFTPQVQKLLAAAIVDAMHNVYVMTILACGVTTLLSPLLGFRKVGGS